MPDFGNIAKIIQLTLYCIGSARNIYTIISETVVEWKRYNTLFEGDSEPVKALLHYIEYLTLVLDCLDRCARSLSGALNNIPAAESSDEEE